MGDGSDWYAGIQSSHGVINLHFVYTSVTVFSLCYWRGFLTPCHEGEGEGEMVVWPS